MDHEMVGGVGHGRDAGDGQRSARSTLKAKDLENAGTAANQELSGGFAADLNHGKRPRAPDDWSQSATGLIDVEAVNPTHSAVGSDIEIVAASVDGDAERNKAKRDGSAGNQGQSSGGRVHLIRLERRGAALSGKKKA